MFLKCEPVDGLISGEKGREIFRKSRLSAEILSQIWSFADTHDRDALDETDFSVGMYLIQALMNGLIHEVLITSSNPLPPFIRTAFSSRTDALDDPASGGRAHVLAWMVEPSEKAIAKQWFDTLASHQHPARGYIEALQAVPFMLQSGLSSEELADIWDVSCLTTDARLTREEFTVACCLIKRRLAGHPIPVKDCL